MPWSRSGSHQLEFIPWHLGRFSEISIPGLPSEPHLLPSSSEALGGSFPFISPEQRSRLLATSSAPRRPRPRAPSLLICWTTPSRGPAGWGCVSGGMQGDATAKPHSLCSCQYTKKAGRLGGDRRLNQARRSDDGSHSARVWSVTEPLCPQDCKSL